MRTNITNLKRKTEGFTIIEVLIVLAIAGLILLIVFLAVPALQRNARNSSRKNDASRIATASSNFVNNNNGTQPAATVADTQTILDDSGKFGQYTLVGSTAPGAGKFAVLVGAQAAPVGPVDNYVVLDEGAKCGTGGATLLGTNRQMAFVYTIEKTNGFTPVCIDI